VFQACLGSPATSSHCSHTPKFALKKASFCLPLRRSCRNLSSAAADLNPTQPPYHCRKAFKAGMQLKHTLFHRRQWCDVMRQPFTCCKHEQCHANIWRKHSVSCVSFVGRNGVLACGRLEQVIRNCTQGKPLPKQLYDTWVTCFSN